MSNLFRSFIVTLIFLMIIFLSIIGIAYNTKLTEEYTRINRILLDADIIIPDDYKTIQQGIDNANPGDIIFVRSSKYIENIEINNQGINIIGENKFDTIIDGNKISDTVVVSASDIMFKNFNVTNGISDETKWHISGVKILSSNVTIENCIITKNRLGISVLADNLNISDITDDPFVISLASPGEPTIPSGETSGKTDRVYIYSKV